MHYCLKKIGIKVKTLQLYRIKKRGKDKVEPNERAKQDVRL